MSKVGLPGKQYNSKGLHNMTVKKCYQCFWKLCTKTVTKYQKNPISNKKTQMADLTMLSLRIFGVGSSNERGQFLLTCSTASSSLGSNAVFAVT